MELNDTIVALSSAAGPGARAVVRLSGSDALAIVQTIFQPAEILDSTRRRWLEGTVRLTGLHAPLAAGLLVWPAPRTYTGQTMAELHLISSPPLIERVVSALLDAGARAARPGEFTMRAFLAGKRDLPRAEAVQAVVSAASRDELKQALIQLAGGMTRPLEGLRDDLLNLLADIEAALDFTDEDIEFVAREDVLVRLGKGLAQLATLERQLQQRGAGDRPFRVVLAGAPNAGKSRLFNSLTGADALVSETPGTTRDYLIQRRELDGRMIEFADTAGWQNAENDIDRQAQEQAAEQTRLADLVVLCVESGRPLTAAERTWLAQTDPPVLGVATKCDLAGPAGGLLPTSAVTGEGIVELTKRITDLSQRHGGPALAPSLSRCRHHVTTAREALRRAHAAVLFDDPPEILALDLRTALDELGNLTGTIHTDDLLDRIFSRFCIGK